MKKVIIVRHAKSSWKDTTLSDMERPLNKRGKRDAPMMAERLAKNVGVVDAIVSSPAVRARRTATTFAKKLGYAKKNFLDEKLYDASEWQILQVIQSLDNAFKSAIVIGHNPGITDLVNQISGKRIENVPTCGVVVLEFNAETWENIGLTKPVRFDFDYPKKEGAAS